MTPRAASKTTSNVSSFAVPVSLPEWEELLKTGSEASGVGLCILDTDYRYVAINDTMAQMNGIEPQAHLGKSVREILGDFAELVEPQFDSIMRAKRSKNGRVMQNLIDA